MHLSPLVGNLRTTRLAEGTSHGPMFDEAYTCRKILDSCRYSKLERAEPILPSQSLTYNEFGYWGSCSGSSFCSLWACNRIFYAKRNENCGKLVVLCLRPSLLCWSWWSPIVLLRHWIANTSGKCKQSGFGYPVCLDAAKKYSLLACSYLQSAAHGSAQQQPSAILTVRRSCSRRCSAAFWHVSVNYAIFLRLNELNREQATKDSDRPFVLSAARFRGLKKTIFSEPEIQNAPY